MSLDLRAGPNTMSTKRGSNKSGSRPLAASPKRGLWDIFTRWIPSCLKPTRKVVEVLQQSHHEGEAPNEPGVTCEKPKNYTIQPVETVSRKDLTVHDTIIALVGPTGVGKSNFIQRATGLKEAGVHSGLNPGTSSITAVRVAFADGASVVLVDTPGFLTDAYKSDQDILGAIAEWLHVDGRRDEFKVSGILYLRRISDNDMREANDPPLKPEKVKLFKKLCGESFSGRIILTTWPEYIDEETYNKKEEELRNVYWSDMIRGGSSVCHFQNTLPSAREILDVIVGGLEKRWVGVRKELAEMGKSLTATKAGDQFHSALESIKEQQRDLLRRIEASENWEKAPQVRLALLNELDELREGQDKAIRDMQRSNPLFGKLKRIYIKARTMTGHKPVHA